MFGLFRKKTTREKLEDQYKKLLAEAHALSHTNRRASDQKTAEAEEVARALEQLGKP